MKKQIKTTFPESPWQQLWGQVDESLWDRLVKQLYGHFGWEIKEQLTGEVDEQFREQREIFDREVTE